MNALTNDQLSQVCIAYEDIKRRYNANKLTSIPLKNLDEAPSIPGIYFAVTEVGEIVYIGMSMDLKTRCNLRSHHKLPSALELGAEVLLVARVDESIVSYVEKALIMYFNPKLNQAHARSEDSVSESFEVRVKVNRNCENRNTYLSAKIQEAMRKKRLMGDINLPPDVPF